MSVLFSKYEPGALSFEAVEGGRKTLCDEVELILMRLDDKKKEEHLCFVMSPAQFNSTVISVSFV